MSISGYNKIKPRGFTYIVPIDSGAVRIGKRYKIVPQPFGSIWASRPVNSIGRNCIWIVQKVFKEEFPQNPPIDIMTTPSDDIRSYRISSEKIKKELGFVPRHTIEDAVRDLIKAFKAGKFVNSFENPKYFNIKMLKSLEAEARVSVRLWF